MAGDHYAVDTTGIEIDEVYEDSVWCSLAVFEKHCNVRGVVMGGAIFTLADFSAAILVNYPSILNDWPFQWVTVSSDIHFLLPATGSHLKAHSSFIRQGRSLSVICTEIVDSDNRTIASVTTTSSRIKQSTNNKLNDSN